MNKEKIDPEFFLQRILTAIGMVLLISSFQVLNLFLIRRTYLTGISWFIILIISILILIYREERLNKFVLVLEDEA